MKPAQRFYIVGQRYGRSTQPKRQAVHLSHARVDAVEATVQGDGGDCLLSMEEAAAALGYQKRETAERFLRRRGVLRRLQGMKACRVLASDVAAIIAEAAVWPRAQVGGRHG